MSRRAGLLAVAMACGCGGGVSPADTMVGQDAGTDGDAAAPVGCTGTQPATMVALPEGYSIDSTEVTRCQYQVWLDTKPSTEGQHAWCSWNSDFTPYNEAGPAACAWPPGDKGNGPVMCVDWCDAFASCPHPSKT